jgi:hypothetical protein
MVKFTKHDYSFKGKILVVIIALLVGALHFVIGRNYEGPYKDFMSSYLIDVVLPAVLFLLFHLVFQRHFMLKHSRGISFALVLAIGSLVEILQYLGVPVLGNTFDPWDFLMYFLGAGIGWILDIAILKRYSVPA